MCIEWFHIWCCLSDCSLNHISAAASSNCWRKQSKDYKIIFSYITLWLDPFIWRKLFILGFVIFKIKAENVFSPWQLLMDTASCTQYEVILTPIWQPNPQQMPSETSLLQLPYPGLLTSMLLVTIYYPFIKKPNVHKIHLKV